MKFIARALVFLGAICAFLAEAPNAVQAEEGQGKLKVLATIPPLLSFARNVAGDRAEVESLLPPGISPHDYALAPGDLKRINKADVILMVGLGLDDWLHKAVDGKPADRLVEVGEKVATIPTQKEIEAAGHGHGHDGHDGHGHGHGHDHGDVNPHVWLDPVRAKSMVETIREALAKADPAGADYYRSQAEAYSKRLDALNEEAAAQLKPHKGAPLVTLHDAFGYFADRYGLRIAAVFAEFPGKEPSPKYLKRLGEVIRNEKVKVLFTEPGYSPQVLQSMAQEVGARIAVLDPMESGDGAPDFYERAMRSNVAAVLEAIDGK